MSGRKRLDVPKKIVATFTVTPNFLEKISIHARKRGVSVSEFIEISLINQMENDGDLCIRRDMKMEKGEEYD